MARIYGVNYEDLKTSEKYVYMKVATQLPDYVHAIFALQIPDAKGMPKTELDCVIVIPHLAVFAVEIYGGRIGFENGDVIFTHKDGRKTHRRSGFLAQRSKYELKHLFDRKLRNQLHINPNVIEINCFPDVFLDEDYAEYLIHNGVHPNRIISGNDLADGKNLLSKFMRIYANELDGNNYGEIPHSQREFGGQLPEGNDTDSWGFSDINDDNIYDIMRCLLGKEIENYRPEKPPHLFLSFSSKNNDTAEKIRNSIERKRKVYIYKCDKDIPISTDYEIELEENIKNCSGVILLLSAASQESNEVKKEVLWAEKYGKKIYPLKIDTAPMNDFFMEHLKHVQWRIYDELDNPEAVLDEIVEAMGKK